jgi:hypothetical protein
MDLANGDGNEDEFRLRSIHFTGCGDDAIPVGRQYIEAIGGGTGDRNDRHTFIFIIKARHGVADEAKCMHKCVGVFQRFFYV